MQEIELIAVTEAVVLDITSPKGRKRQALPRDFYSLSYRFDGEITVDTQERSLVSVADTVTFVPRGVAYETEVRADTHMIVVHFKLARDIEIRHPEVIRAEGTGLRSLFKELLASYRVGASTNFRCLSVLYGIFDILERSRIDRTPSCVALAKRIIDERFSDPLLSLSEVAAEVGVSDSYLRRMFRRTANGSAVDYLCRVRIKNAKSMLESDYFTVAEIGSRSGFRDACYFVRKFRERIGMTPGEYRKKINNGKA